MEGRVALTLLPQLDCAVPAVLRASQRVRSRYQRLLANLPIAGRLVELFLTVRRFFCGNAVCKLKTFAEQVDGLTRRRARPHRAATGLAGLDRVGPGWPGGSPADPELGNRQLRRRRNMIDMAFWQHSPDDVVSRLAEIADLFVASRDAFFETADRFHWKPAQGSPAAHSAAELPSPDPSVAQPRGETGHRLIAEVVQTYLLTASGHVGGLASLYASCEVIFPTPALIRSTIENCAHAVWVLGKESDESSENRLARAYLEELVSAEEAKKNAGRMRAKTHPNHLLADKHYMALKDEIIARFPGTTKEELGKRTLNGQTLPNLEAAVSWMYDLTQSYGGTIDSRVGTGIYGLLSNMTHPTLYPARQRREWSDDPVTGHQVAYLRVDVDFAENAARAALSTFYNALNYTTSYFGWPSAVIDELTAKIEESMPTFFVD